MARMRGTGQPKASNSLFARQEQPLLMLMDGHALVHRAWHALQQPLTIARTGEEVRGVFGFTNTFLRALQDWQPTHCAIAFDLPTPTFRDQLYAEYKATRPPTPDELRAQFPRVRQVMEAFSVPIYTLEGYEADDVLGALCRQAEEQRVPVVILTGDTDILQLVSPWVRVALYRSTQDRIVYDETTVSQRYGGLRPSQQPDVKALQGDTSDNVPGVRGIGDKTAIKLIQQFGAVEQLVEHLNQVESPRLRQSLAASGEQLFRNKRLVTIVRDLPLTLDLDQCRFGQFDRQRVLDLLREMEFNSIVPRIPQPMASSDSPALKAAPTPTASSVDYRVVDTEERLQELAQRLAASGGFALDTETTSLNPMEAELVGLSLSPTPSEAFYIPVGHREGRQLPVSRVLEVLRPVLEDEAIPKTAHNANYDLSVLANYGVTVRNLAFDTMVAAFLAGDKAIGLKPLAFARLGMEMTPIASLLGTGRKQTTMDRVSIADAAPYACADADMTLRLRHLLEGELRPQERLWQLFTTVEMPLVPVLMRMERHGVALDLPVLRGMSQELAGEMARLEGEVYAAVGHQFNINSPSQLGDILFKELKLPGARRTKTGYSTDASVLEGLRGAHPVVEPILQFRELAKLKSTYVDTLPALVNSRTGRVHTSYNLTGAATGRISSSDPNLQNIPVRTEIGRRVRKAFIAQDAPRWLLLSADYSQIELRVLAHLSRDPGLLEAFGRDEDIHAATASSVYGVPLDQVVPDMRRIAKVLNFGVIYGISAFGIVQQTGLSHEEGASFIQSYFAKYPGVSEYLERVKAEAREKGYVETLLGRRRAASELHSSNFQARQATERWVVNFPIQGTAAEVMKLAMLLVDQALQERRLRTRMLLQVHDELIFEAPQEELEEVQGLVLDRMPRAMELAVPLKVELKSGATWGDME